MTTVGSDVHRDAVERVAAAARERNGRASGPFLERYLERAATADLLARPPDVAAAAALGHFRFGERRPAGEPLVRVFTPVEDLDGWTSASTVVEIITDDMPFLVDSVQMAVVRANLGIRLLIHPILPVERDADGWFTGLAEGAPAESWIHLEADEVSSSRAATTLRTDLETVLAEVRAAVEDWPSMVALALGEAEELDVRAASGSATAAEDREAAELLRWMADDHFVFLGSREDRLEGTAVRPEHASGLGVLRNDLRRTPDRRVTELRAEAAAAAAEPRVLLVTRSERRSRVHRPDHLAHVGIRRIDRSGRAVGERRWVGLWTAQAYRSSAMEIPFLRRRIETVLADLGLPLDSHDGRALWNIIETYPRDELFQVSVEELTSIATSILELQDRRQVRVLARRDAFGRFVSCLVYLPRERFSSTVQQRIADTLNDAYGGSGYDVDALLGDGVLARVHVVVHLPPDAPLEVDDTAVERRVTEVCRWWLDDLADACRSSWGDLEGTEWFDRWRDAFPSPFRDTYDGATAVRDAAQLEALAPGGIAAALQPPASAAGTDARVRVYSPEPVALSRLVPLLEHLGFTVVDERPFEVRPEGGTRAWIHDVGVRSPAAGSLADAELRATWQEAFAAVWSGQADDDGLNRLVLAARLTWRDVSVVRAYVRYLRQIGLPLSSEFVADALVRHPDVASELARLFALRFDPAGRADEEAATHAYATAAALVVELEAALDAVERLDDDRALRTLLALVLATVRTNAYRAAAGGTPVAPVLAFKLDPHRVPDLPAPRPVHEIWVHSPRVEGVHLRGGDVARGGLRWSDRSEDFRTEVLGLMKAQMVKNAVIVPVGAKGGFVVRRLPDGAEAQRAEVEACYRAFVGGLLDVTDNLVRGEVVGPVGVVRHDGADPYLVVAADKGTATFSDLANEVAAGYGFWLGDAFASGGSAGYDHKAMGITARGAWESVRRHGRQAGIDVDRTPLTVVGIGDMSGDVFGNGMLQSTQLRLVAAFDHRDLFLDPDPDPAVQHPELVRLFQTPRSSWQQFNRDLLSAGGGVYSRSAKSVPLSVPVRARLGIDAEALPPNEVIRAILRAEVDLLWVGGIGTYVKASSERNADVGDRANDAVRVDGSSLRCRIVGEGGNLGFTQRGRVEAALAGVRLNTDAIDNSAGVDCSDHEVNLKILLDGAVADGALELAQRNELLEAMTDEVAALVLDDNVEQNVALAVAAAQAVPMVEVHARYVRSLEREGLIDRELEQLPTEQEFARRQAEGRGLTSPEVAVLLAYTKTTDIAEVVASDLPDDPDVASVLSDYFPRQVRGRFAEQITRHPLRRQITATRVVNDMVNHAGTSFDHRMAEETGAAVPDITRAHLVSAGIFGLAGQWREVLALDPVVASDQQVHLFIQLRLLVERGALWMLRHRGSPLPLAATVEAFRPGVDEVAAGFESVVSGHKVEQLRAGVAAARAAGVPDDLAMRSATWPLLPTTLDVVEVAVARGRRPLDAAAVYWSVLDRLDLDWVWDRVAALPRHDRWQTHARAALRDDLLQELRRLTDAVLRSGDVFTPAGEAVEQWLAAERRSVARLAKVFAEIKAAGTYDLATLSVALRQLRTLSPARP